KKLTYNFFFFFSSRRRHTRFDCDWSSDVCSSDLRRRASAEGARRSERRRTSRRTSRSFRRGPAAASTRRTTAPAPAARGAERIRSEERRVGKEGRGVLWEEHNRRSRYNCGWLEMR